MIRNDEAFRVSVKQRNNYKIPKQKCAWHETSKSSMIFTDVPDSCCSQMCLRNTFINFFVKKKYFIHFTYQSKIPLFPLPAPPSSPHSILQEGLVPLPSNKAQLCTDMVLTHNQLWNSEYIDPKRKLSAKDASRSPGALQHLQTVTNVSLDPEIFALKKNS
ncbi:hypothetical protein STEG23_006902 [Scotinomys teguina]